MDMVHKPVSIQFAGNKSKKVNSKCNLEVFGEYQLEEPEAPDVRKLGSSFSWVPAPTTESLKEVGVDLEDEFVEETTQVKKKRIYLGAGCTTGAAGTVVTDTNDKRESRYIEKLNKTAEIRIIENEMVEESKARRELAQAGREGAPAFVTGAYQKKLEQRKTILSKLNEIESEGKNKKDLAHFYSYMMRSGQASRTNVKANEMSFVSKKDLEEQEQSSSSSKSKNNYPTITKSELMRSAAEAQDVSKDLTPAQASGEKSVSKAGAAPILTSGEATNKYIGSRHGERGDDANIPGQENAEREPDVLPHGKSFDPIIQEKKDRAQLGASDIEEARQRYLERKKKLEI